MHRPARWAWLAFGPYLALLSSPAASARPAARPDARVVWTAGPPAARDTTPEQAARAHLHRLRRDHGAPAAAIDGARHLYTHDLGRGGVIVALRPTVGGVDLVHADVKVLLDRALRPLAVSGAPHPAAVPGAARPFRLAAPEAVAAAVREAFGADVPSDRIVPSREPPRAGAVYFEVGGGPRLRRPARVWPVYAPIDGALVPAYRIELQVHRVGPRDPGSAELLVAADDARILERRDLARHAGFQYRVWADPDGRPLDGPLTDVTPHPTGAPEPLDLSTAATALIAMEGFNTNPDGVADPWLPPGATETRGNNIEAFAEHTDPDGPGPETLLFAKTTAPGVFDYTYNLAAEPIADLKQAQAAITQLFYTTNWLHDWWYDSGFTEAAGNAQRDNFGRGGVADDPMRAIAQDGALDGARDNAFMETPLDGESPRMHMFLWSSLTSSLSLTVDPGNQSIPAGQAVFGPKIYDVTAPLALYDDGAGKSPTDGCEPAKLDLTGKIALIDRGTCSFELKAQHALAAGAVGAIYPDLLVAMEPYPPGPLDPDIVDPPLPGQGITKADGEALKAALKNGPVTAHMVGDTPPERDGTLDDMVVAHEWGHYIHYRLVDCGTYACGAQSEGWGDFLALHLAARAGDDLGGVFVAMNYAGLDPLHYYGVRRVPYSVDFTRDALTFRHVTDGEPLPAGIPLQPNGAPNSEFHNAGEIWATMMWEVYVAIHAASAGEQTFDEVRRAMSDYVVAGMMLAPPGPTLLEQRDALLAAIAAADPGHFAAASAAFARRGAGSCALGPSHYSTTFEGVLEDFEVRPIGAFAEVVIDDGPQSCDHDGALDNGESGALVVTLRNDGGADLSGAVLTVAGGGEGLVFPEGTSRPLADLAPLAEATVTLPIALAAPLADVEETALVLTLTTPGGCTTLVQHVAPTVLQGDRADAASAKDDVEADGTLWTVAGLGGEAVWSRQPLPASGIGWHGLDLPAKTDAWLVSPPLDVSPDAPLKISFEHTYSFDAVPALDDAWLNWDGGVIELTQDGGKTWEDVSKYGDPHYDDTIAASANPLSNRPAYVRTNPSYPQPDTVTIDLGEALAGKQIRVRFRLGTDALSGSPGWDVDNILFGGITNTPFPGWVPETGCETAPTTGDTAGSSSGDGVTGDDSATTGPQQAGDDGCACRSGAPPTGWLLAPWLLLAGLRRRRR